MHAIFSFRSEVFVFSFFFFLFFYTFYFIFQYHLPSPCVSAYFLPLFFSHLCDHLPFLHYTYILLSSLHSQHLSLVFLHPCISLSCLPESACQHFLVSFHCFQPATGSLWVVFFLCASSFLLEYALSPFSH